MYIEKSLKEALEDYMLGRPVTVLWTGNDGGMNAMKLSDLLEQEENHYLVNVPAEANPEFEQAVREMDESVQPAPEEIIQAVHETQESITPTREAGGKDGRRNDRSSGGQYRR